MAKKKLFISEMYAFISTDDEGEGVMAFLAQNGTWMPMVGADMTRVEQLKPIAINMGKAQGRKVKLIKFSQREELEVLT
jgi:hypothetical protein